MFLNVLKRKGKEYLYFQMGRKRLYIGSDDKPRLEDLDKAITDMRSHIKECEGILTKLEGLKYRGIIPEEARSPVYQLLVFNSDGTVFDKPWHETTSNLTAVSTWDLIFKEIGIYAMHERLKARFERGEFEKGRYERNYMNWTDEACRVLKSYGLRKEDFEEIINSRPFSPGVHELFKGLKRLNIKTALVTGSFLELANRAKDELGIDEVAAHCELKFSRDGLLEDWVLKDVDYEDKPTFVEETAKKYGIHMEEVAYVGDDVNDIPVFEKVGLAIAFNAKKDKVIEKADIVIEGIDLRAILKFLFVKRPKIPLKKAV